MCSSDRGSSSRGRRCESWGYILYIDICMYSKNERAGADAIGFVKRNLSSKGGKAA